MSADTYDCKRCEAIVFTEHKAHHDANLCRTLRKRRMEAARMRKRRGPAKGKKLAKCALEECGAEFLSQGVAHRYCCPRHADRARWGDTEAAEAAQRVLEMAPLAREAELVRLAAEAVPLLSSEASHALWLRCLGVAA